MNITSLLKPGVNVLSVAAVNATSSPNPAGLIGSLSLQFASGASEKIATDASWSAASAVAQDWQTSAKDEIGWTAALAMGPQGIAPWGDIDATATATATATDPTPEVGSLCRLMAQLGVPPDFSSQTQAGSNTLRYIHRSIDGTDVYFVANKNPRDEEAICSFRVDGRRPELWHPDTGLMEQTAIYDVADGCVRMPIRFEPSGSVFVVFRRGEKVESNRVTSILHEGSSVANAAALQGQKLADSRFTLARSRIGRLTAQADRAGKYEIKTADGRTHQFAVGALPSPVIIDGSWDLHFPSHWGAPESVLPAGSPSAVGDSGKKVIRWSNPAF
jgi:hypothetical protein